jgi:hypothetical protein
MSATQSAETSPQAPTPSNGKTGRKPGRQAVAEAPAQKAPAKRAFTPPASGEQPNGSKQPEARAAHTQARGKAAHPLAQGLAETILQAGPHWSKEHIKEFEAAVSGAMPVICAPAA